MFQFRLKNGNLEDIQEPFSKPKKGILYLNNRLEDQ